MNSPFLRHIDIQCPIHSAKEIYQSSTYKWIEGPTLNRGKPNGKPTTASLASLVKPLPRKSKHSPYAFHPIVENLCLSLAQRGSVASIIKAIEDYIQGQINKTVERRNFRKCIQQPGESFDDFLVSLRELVKTCSFCDDACERKSIRDQIIEGILDGEMTDDLLQAKDLTLDTAIS